MAAFPLFFCFVHHLLSTLHSTFLMLLNKGHLAAVGEAVVEGTILEDTEDENTQMMPARVVKSPSLPINKRLFNFLLFLVKITILVS